MGIGGFLDLPENQEHMSSNESTKVDMGTILSKFRGTNPPMGMGLHCLLDSRGTHHPKSSKVGGAQYLLEVRGT